MPEELDRTKYLDGEWFDYMEVYEDKIVIYDTLSEALKETEGVEEE